MKNQSLSTTEVRALNVVSVTDIRCKVFLAGGISGCPDWQMDATEILSKHEGMVLMNPRRDSIDMDNPEESREQIRWEFRHLKIAEIVLFWFPKETVCPITLFELGKMINTNKVLAIGTHPEYSRRFDVVEQLHLVRPGVKVYDNLNDTCGQVLFHLNGV
jgi:hypothetical protein